MFNGGLIINEDGMIHDGKGNYIGMVRTAEFGNRVGPKEGPITQHLTVLNIETVVPIIVGSK